MIQKSVFPLILVFLAFSTVFGYGNGPGTDTTKFYGQQTYPAKVTEDKPEGGAAQEQDQLQNGNPEEDNVEEPDSKPSKEQANKQILPSDGELPELSNVNDMFRSMTDPEEMNLKDRILYNAMQNRMDRIAEKQETQNIDSETILLVILLVILLAVLGHLIGINLLELILGALLILALILAILYLAEEV